MKLALIAGLGAVGGAAMLVQSPITVDWDALNDILTVFGVIALLLSPWVVQWGRRFFGGKTEVKANTESIETLKVSQEEIKSQLREAVLELKEIAKRQDGRLKHMEDLATERHGRICNDLENLGNIKDRVHALEQEDIRIRSDIARLGTEVKRVEGIDRRLYRVAAVLATAYPEAAKNLNLLEEVK